ncbi:carbohydrate ABC transporter substrate-binding protein [Paenibacillus hemerocallicola]|jgi:multiple sugar transport system substrate-binding protein|uniref:Carbohydrate ABC transporter substrate-binding protein n=1 Tax=Paenibacillus hemerocallicola TaxID=1172614 RepID=A0A5C4SYA0_9BACL|nr:ABC transporter substrate-binding protein [Paenibacillus hemerocallicola]TNJ61210.1 carbohydrate ABC transporter substrate-binding protein [Paenibacillus hemerocallicola]
MINKSIRVSLASAMVVSLLAACGGKGSTSGESEKGSETQKPREPVEISIFHYNGTWSQEQNDKVFAEPITKKYPYIKVKAISYQGPKQLEEMVVSGTLPDLIMTTPGPGFETTIRKYESQFDLTPLIKQYKYDLNQLDPSAVGSVRSLSTKGELFSLPIYMAPNTLYYNKTIFDKFGVAYPKDGMSWDDVYELSKRLTRNDNGVQYRGFLASYVHLMRLNQVSQKLFDGTGQKVAFDTSEFKNYLKDIFRIYELPGYGFDKLSIESNVLNGLFLKEQTVAMLEPGGTLLGEESLAGLGNNWDFTSFPSIKDKPGVGYQPYPFLISMFNTSKHKEEAFEAMAYLTSAEFQTAATKQGTLLPVLKDKSILQQFGQESAFYKGKNVGVLMPKQFAPVPDEPFSEFTATAQTALYGIYKKVVTGNADINTAFREGTEEANKKIEELKAAKK